MGYQRQRVWPQPGESGPKRRKIQRKIETPSPDWSKLVALWNLRKRGRIAGEGKDRRGRIAGGERKGSPFPYLFTGASSHSSLSSLPTCCLGKRGVGDPSPPPPPSPLLPHPKLLPRCTILQAEAAQWHRYQPPFPPLSLRPPHTHAQQ
jgi:hypothetical protein